MTASRAIAWFLLAAVTGCGTQLAGQQAGAPGTVPAPGAGSATPGAGSAAAGTSYATARSATASPAGIVTASPPASSPPAITGPATLTVADSGAVVWLQAGQQVTVTLTADGLLAWHIPAVAGTAVRRISARGGYPGRAPAQAVFTAVRPGRATLTAIDDTACLHSVPACELPQRDWQVTVIVAR